MNEIFENEDIVYEIIRNSPWLLASQFINKMWNRLSNYVILTAHKTDFIELCKRNNYLSINYLLRNYYCEMKKLKISNESNIRIFDYNISVITSNDLFCYENPSVKFDHNNSKFNIRDEKTNTPRSIDLFDAILSYNDGWSDNLHELFKEKGTDEALKIRINYIYEGLDLMLYNKNNIYTTRVIDNFIKYCEIVFFEKLINISLISSNYEVYRHFITTHPKSFNSNYIDPIFQTGNIDIINFFLSIKNTKNDKIYLKYNAGYSLDYKYRYMSISDWKNALFNCINSKHLEGIKLILANVKELIPDNSLAKDLDYLDLIENCERLISQYTK